MVKFKVEHRSYGGKIFRPRPEVYISEANDLVIIATPWGAREGARKIIDRMLDFLALANSDRETTSPFQRLSCLSPMANNLRISAFLANDLLYRDDNREEFRSGVEVLAIAASGNEVVWLQVGNPQILISRGHKGLLPLGSQSDLSLDLSEDIPLPPLPGHLLGLDSTANPTINSFRANKNDQLILLSHSRPSSKIFGLSSSKLTVDGITRLLATEDQESPFWICQVKIEVDSTTDETVKS
jgi:hypothetical protein